MSHAQDLMNFGFRMIGKWELNNSFKSVTLMAHLPGINFIVDNPLDKNEKHVTYAFLFGEVIGYIGSTRQTIYARLSQYRRGFSDNSRLDKGENDTDNRVKEAVTQALIKDTLVSIWIAQPKAVLFLYDGSEIEIDAYDSMEKHLIPKYIPIINRS